MVIDGLTVYRRKRPGQKRARWQYSTDQGQHWLSTKAQVLKDAKAFVQERFKGGTAVAVTRDVPFGEYALLAVRGSRGDAQGGGSAALG